MHAVITGAAGFIGSHLAEACLARGWTVTAVDCFTDYYPRALKLRNISEAADNDRYHLVEADLAVDPIEPLVEGAEVIFHLAAQPGVRASWGSSFDVYTQANVVALQRVLEAVKERPLRKFMFASSSSIYGDAERLPTGEDTAPAPVSPYGATKVLGEHLCRIYRRSYDVPVVVLRYFTVYGPRQRPDMAFWRLIDSALNGTPMMLYGDGSQTRDFTFVADTVDATIEAAQRASAGATYNVGGGSAVSLAAAIEAITREVGSAPTLRREPNQRGDARDTAADTARIARELQYVPQFGLEDGLARQIAWQRSLPGSETAS